MPEAWSVPVGMAPPSVPGSVGLNCVLHADCPVLIVRPTHRAELNPATGAAGAPAP